MKFRLFFLVLVSLCVFQLAFAASDNEKAQNVARKAAGTLGWPEDFRGGENIENIPGTPYLVSEDEKGSETR